MYIAHKWTNNYITSLHSHQTISQMPLLVATEQRPCELGLTCLAQGHSPVVQRCFEPARSSHFASVVSKLCLTHSVNPCSLSTRPLSPPELSMFVPLISLSRPAPIWSYSVDEAVKPSTGTKNTFVHLPVHTHFSRPPRRTNTLLIKYSVCILPPTCSYRLQKKLFHHGHRSRWKARRARNLPE